MASFTSSLSPDSEAFAIFVNDKFQFNSWGKQKIRAHIYSHKLSDQAVTKALDRIDPQAYENRLFDLAKSKWDKLEKEDGMKRKQKTVAYLAQKGYEMDLIWSAISKVEDESR